MMLITFCFWGSGSEELLDSFSVLIFIYRSELVDLFLSMGLKACGSTHCVLTNVMNVRSESIELQWPKHNHDCNQFVAIFLPMVLINLCWYPIGLNLLIMLGINTI